MALAALPETLTTACRPFDASAVALSWTCTSSDDSFPTDEIRVASRLIESSRELSAEFGDVLAAPALLALEILVLVPVVVVFEMFMPEIINEAAIFEAVNN